MPKVIDFTKNGKGTLVVNTQNTPVVINSQGQQLGGQQIAKLSLSDPIAKRAVEAGLILVIS